MRDPAPQTPDRPERSDGGARAILADPATGWVTLCALVVMVGFGAVAPILPLFARSLGAGYAGAGLMVSAFALTRLAADLAVGTVIDRVGEKRAAAGGLAVLTAASLATGVAPTLRWAVIAWALGGAGSALLFASMYSYLLKVVPRHRMARTLSIFYGSFNAGMMAGGIAGGALAHRFGLASPLFLYAGLLAIAAGLFLKLVPDPGPPDLPARPPGPAAIRRLLAIPGFRTTLVVNLAYMWVIAAVFDTLMPLFARDSLRMSTVGIGAVFAISLSTELATVYPAGRAADRRGRKPVLRAALVGLALMAASLGWAPTAVGLGILMALLGIASGLAGVPPAAMLSDLTPPERSGTAIGMFRFSGDLGFGLGPAIAGLLIDPLGFRWAFALTALPVAAALALVLRIPETLRRPGAAAAPGFEGAPGAHDPQ